MFFRPLEFKKVATYKHIMSSSIQYTHQVIQGNIPTDDLTQPWYPSLYLGEGEQGILEITLEGDTPLEYIYLNSKMSISIKAYVNGRWSRVPFRKDDYGTPDSFYIYLMGYEKYRQFQIHCTYNPQPWMGGFQSMTLYGVNGIN